jgi:hypothetical protein
MQGIWTKNNTEHEFFSCNGRSGRELFLIFYAINVELKLGWTKIKKGKGIARNIETTFITTEFYNLQFSWFFWKAYHSNTKEWIHDSRPGCPQTHITSVFRCRGANLKKLSNKSPQESSTRTLQQKGHSCFWQRISF